MEYAFSEAVPSDDAGLALGLAAFAEAFEAKRPYEEEEAGATLTRFPFGVTMSLYFLQKLFYNLNRDPLTQKRFASDRAGLLSEYDLTREEREAVEKPDIGLLFVLGVNGQLLMHYAAFRGLEWSAYIDAMREGVKQHGPVRAGIYAMTTELDEKMAGI